MLTCAGDNDLGPEQSRVRGANVLPYSKANLLYCILRVNGTCLCRVEGWETRRQALLTSSSFFNQVKLRGPQRNLQVKQSQQKHTLVMQCAC